MAEDNPTPDPGGTPNSSTAAPKSKTNTVKFFQYGCGAFVGLGVLIVALAIIFAPSKEEVEARARVERATKDSLAAIAHVKDSIRNAEEKAAYDALPQRVKDSIKREERAEKERMQERQAAA